MRALSGQVVAGQVVVTDGELPDGATVTVLLDDDEGPPLSDADVAALQDAHARIVAGEFITADEAFEHLRSKRQ